MQMNKILSLTLLLITISTAAKSQSLSAVAESLRIEYNIPELGYAVVSSDSILEINTLGYKRASSTIPAEPDDRFHLGSNTKAITGLVAALLVKQNKINWGTKIFDLCPELKTDSDSAYHDITLVDLLTHKARIQPFTDGEEYPNPLVGKFKGDASTQRYQFVEWVLTLDPVKSEERVSYSNAGYSAAAVMLEKASGKSWENLVLDLGKKLGVDFGFSWPNICDSSQPWGHWGVGNKLIPTPPNDSYRLFWVEPAGDINMSISDYAKFIQLQLLGLEGRSSLLSKEEFEFIHYGVPESDHYSIGWTWAINKRGHYISAHNGSAETFYCFAYIIKDIERAYIVFANCGSEQADAGVRKLLSFLINKFGN
jgi:D-alanyl-D-alanine carboxypeptidase